MGHGRPRSTSAPCTRRRASALLRASAEALEAVGDELVATAAEETALTEERLGGELTRTTGQLRLFADEVDEGSWMESRVDSDTADVRTMNVPIGPVVVFAASNFPFAFSVPGRRHGVGARRRLPGRRQGAPRAPRDEPSWPAAAMHAAVAAVGLPRRRLRSVVVGDVDIGHRPRRAPGDVRPSPSPGRWPRDGRSSTGRRAAAADPRVRRDGQRQPGVRPARRAAARGATRSPADWPSRSRSASGSSARTPASSSASTSTSSPARSPPSSATSPPADDVVPGHRRALRRRRRRPRQHRRCRAARRRADRWHAGVCADDRGRVRRPTTISPTRSSARARWSCRAPTRPRCWTIARGLPGQLTATIHGEIEDPGDVEPADALSTRSPTRSGGSSGTASRPASP